MLAGIVGRFSWLRHVFADGDYAGNKLEHASAASASGPSGSSSDPMPQKASRCGLDAGSSNGPSPGSTETAGSPKPRADHRIGNRMAVHRLDPARHLPPDQEIAPINFESNSKTLTSGAARPVVYPIHQLPDNGQRVRRAASPTVHSTMSGASSSRRDALTRAEGSRDADDNATVFTAVVCNRPVPAPDCIGPSAPRAMSP